MKKRINSRMAIAALLGGILVGCPPVWGDDTGKGATGEPGIPAPAPESFGQDIPDWEARWELARLLSYVKRYDESLSEYRKLLAERPDLTEARAEMAAVYFWNNQPQKAMDLLEQVPMEQLDDEARVMMADIYTAQQQYELAEPLYEAALKTRPQDHGVRLKLADLLSYMKRYDDALVQYERLLEARPRDVQIRRKYARVLSWAGRSSQAITELQKTLQD